MKGLKRLQAGIGIAAVAGALALGTGPAFAAEYEVRMPVEKTVRLAPPDDAAAPAAKPDAPKPDAAKADGAKSSAPKTALGRAAEAAAANASKPAAPKAAAPAVKPAEAAPTVKSAETAPAPVKPADKSADKPKPVAKAKKAKPAQDANAHALSADPDALAEESGVVHVPSGAPIPVPAPGTAPGVAESAPATDKPSAKPVAKAVPAPKPEPRIDPKASVMPPASAGTPTPLALPADGQWVGDVDIEFQADRIILRAATNAAVERVTWFNLTNPAEPRKLAVDLRGSWRKKGNAVLRYDTGPVKAVVTGEHPDRLRLAVEFRDGAVAPQLEPVLENGPKGVSLTIPLAVRLAR